MHSFISRVGPRPPTTGTGQPAAVSRSSRARFLTGLLALGTAFGLSAVFAPSASADLASAGTIDPATQFPVSYTDGNGLALQLCQDGPPNCLAGPEQIQDVHAAGGDAEAFYYALDAEAGPFSLHDALEAAYAADGADQEVVFQRTEVRQREVRLPANTKYTVTDPYGTFTCTTDGTGQIDSNGCRLETTPVPLEFNRALSGVNSRLGPFVTWDTFGSSTGAPPPGFIGDATTPHKVIGSPTGFNAFRVQGPGLTTTCAGGTIPTCVETELFTVQGKVQAGGASAALSTGTVDFGDVPATPPVSRTLTYANTGSVPVTISSVAISGTGAAAFGQQNDCGALPATVAVGARCTITVTYTPDPGKASAATLTITDDTPVATRRVALQGSNLPKMVVVDPAPPAGLVFPSTPVGTTSAQDNVVIGNTGNGPLTVSTIALTGASAAHYKLGPNNTCTGVQVPSDGGCEIGVLFAPTTTGSKTANLRVTDSNGTIVNVPLTSTGGTPPPPGDITAPALTARAPAVNATGVAVGANVTATFSEGVQGVGTATFQLKNSAEQVITATVTNPSGNRWVLNPSANLVPGTRYTATLTGGTTAIRDAANNALVGTTAQPLTWSFTTSGTAPTGDTTAPTVTVRAPAANATGVAVGANVSATFSEAVQGVGTATFQLKNSAGQVITATVTNPSGNRWLLNPNANLARNTVYTVTLTGGATAIRDATGNPLGPISWTFRTVV